MTSLAFSTVALDLDGTLLNTQKSISNLTREVLQSYRQKGGRIVLASERPPHSVAAFAKEFQLPGLHIAYGGNAWVNVTQLDQVPSTTYFRPFDSIVIEHLLQIITQYPEVQALFFSKGQAYMLAPQFNTPFMSHFSTLSQTMKQAFFVSLPKPEQDLLIDPIYQILIHIPPSLIELHKYFSRSHEFICTYSSDSFAYEVTPIGINKGNTLSLLSDHCAFSLDNLLAFGNDLNDISLLSSAKRGIAMENAKLLLKRIAYGGTKPNDQDGVAWGIRKWAYK